MCKCEGKDCKHKKFKGLGILLLIVIAVIKYFKHKKK